MTTGLPERRQLARSELWINLGVTADRWAREVAGTEPGTLPFDQWPADEALRDIATRYDLTPADLVRVLGELGEQCETAAVRAGYERAWIHPEDRP